MSALSFFSRAANRFASRRLLGQALTATIPVSTLVDMGELEQQQVLITLTAALGEYPVAAALQAFTEKFGIRLTPQAQVHASPLVSAIGSSIRAEDVVGKLGELLRTQPGATEAETQQRAIFAGLRHYLGGGLAAHVNPRDNGDAAQANGNHTAFEYFAILDNGAIVSSVFDHSLQALRPRIQHLTAIDHSFVAVHAAAQKGSTSLKTDAAARLNTQYTACYTRPFMEATLFRCKVEAALQYSSAELARLLQSDAGRRQLSRAALNRYVQELESVRPLVRETRCEAAVAPVSKLLPPTAVAELPERIVTKTDAFGIINFTMAPEEWQVLRGDAPDREIFVSLRDRDGQPITRRAIIKNGSFDGEIDQLVLAPSAHEDHTGSRQNARVELNLFVRLPENEFAYARSAAGIFGNTSLLDDRISVGTHILALTPVEEIAALQTNLKRHPRLSTNVVHESSPEDFHAHLVARELLGWTDTAPAGEADHIVASLNKPPAEPSRHVTRHRAPAAQRAAQTRHL